LRADGRVVDLAAAAAAWLHIDHHDPYWEREVELRLPADVGKFLAGGVPSRALAEAALAFASRSATPTGIGAEPLLVDMSNARLLAPLTAPLILCSGAHFQRPGHREFFMRNPHNVLGPSDRTQLPTWLGENFEVQPRVAVIIGERLNRATPAEAQAGIHGYCAAIEFRACDLHKISWAGPMFHLQYPHAQTFDGSLMLGPAIVSKHEVGDVSALVARLSVDHDEIFAGGVPGQWNELVDWICQLSAAVTLQPGTLLIPGASDDMIVRPSDASQCPAELISSATSSSRLRSGTAITLQIEGLGNIETRLD